MRPLLPLQICRAAANQWPISIVHDFGVAGLFFTASSARSVSFPALKGGSLEALKRPTAYLGLLSCGKPSRPNSNGAREEQKQGLEIFVDKRRARTSDNPRAISRAGCERRHDWTLVGSTLNYRPDLGEFKRPIFGQSRAPAAPPQRDAK